MFSMENSSCFFYVLLFCFMLSTNVILQFVIMLIVDFIRFVRVMLNFTRCTVPFAHSFTRNILYIFVLIELSFHFFSLLRLINFRHEFRAIRFFYNTAKNETKTNCQQKHVYIVELTYCTI